MPDWTTCENCNVKHEKPAQMASCNNKYTPDFEILILIRDQTWTLRLVITDIVQM